MPAGYLDPVLGVGWFGKIPAVGDFITRRLPSAFVQPWDLWLQSAIANSRRQLGDSWDDIFLTFPVWRFLIPSGSLGPTPWVGVLMPSIDRVGRHFPLTLAAPLTNHCFNELSLLDLEAQLAAFEKAGLAGLDGEHIDIFDMRIRGIAPISASAATGMPPLTALGNESALGHWTLDRQVDRELGWAAGRQMLSLLGRRALWWLPGNEQTGGTIRLDRWPMSDDAFAALIR